MRGRARWREGHEGIELGGGKGMEGIELGGGKVQVFGRG